MVDNSPEIIIFDANMGHRSRLNSYSSFQWAHNWYETDTFEIQTNRYKQNADMLVEGGFIGIPNILGTGYCIGCVDSIDKPLDETGKSSEIWTVTGRGIESVLRKRQMKHAWASGDGYDTQTSYAETNMRHYVDVEVIHPTDTLRTITGITLETTDGNRGDAIEYKARMNKYLDDVLWDLCVQSGLSFKLVWTGTGKNFVFTIQEGTDLSSLPDKVILSVEFGNVKGYRYSYSILDYRNFVYIGGPGDDVSRVLESVPTTSVPTGWDRNESFVDASSGTTTAERATVGNQELLDRAATQTLDFTFDQKSQAFVLGRDFTNGDVVVVELSGIPAITRQITRITEKYDNQKGKTYEIGVGQKAPDLISLLTRNTKKIAGLSTR